MKKIILIIIVTLISLIGCTKEVEIKEEGNMFTTTCEQYPQEYELSYDDAKYFYERIMALELEETDGGYVGCLGSFSFIMNDGKREIFTIISDEIINIDGKYYKYSDSELYDRTEAIFKEDDTVEDVTYEAYTEDDRFAGHVPHALLDRIITTANANETIVEVKDGNLTFTSQDGEDLGDITGLEGIVGLGWVSDCGGNDHFCALSDDGNAYLFDFNYWIIDGKEDPEYSISDINVVDLDEKIIDIGIYDDSSPFTTCGGEWFYYTLESGKVVNSAGVERKVAHPYYSFLEYDINDDDTKSEYIFFYDDGTINRAFVDYRDQTISEMEALRYEGEEIIAKREGGYLSEDKLYIISDDDRFYIYDLKTDECEVFDDVKVNEYSIVGENHYYPDMVEFYYGPNKKTITEDIQKTMKPSTNFVQVTDEIVREW